MDPQRHPALTTRELWTLVLLQSVALAALGTLLRWWLEVPLHLSWPSLRAALLAVALVAPLLLSSMLLLWLSDGYARAMGLLERVLGPPLRGRDIPALALISAAVEEFFFRGVLQPVVGILPACVLFGAAHVWNRRLLVHGVWAGFAGLLLGLEYREGGNLALPILTHALNNLVGLSLLRRGMGRPLP